MSLEAFTGSWLQVLTPPMTRLLALLFSYLSTLLSVALAPALNRTALAAVVRGSTRVADAVKPRLHRLLDHAIAVAGLLWGIFVGLRTWRRDAAHVLRALAAQRYDRRIAGSEALSLFAVAGPPRLLPRPVRAVAHAVAGGLRTVLDRLELRFVDSLPAPGHARVAASLLTSSLAIACAGLVGLVTVVDPQPVVGMPHRLAAERASGATLSAAALPPGDVAAAAPAPAAPGPADAPVPAPAVAPAAPPAAAASVVLPGEKRGALPIGKGMWIWMHERAEGGDANAIVARAKTWGFTHLYVRTGTLREGFIAGPFLDRLLPVAHANGIRVYGWDFPYMNRPGDDVNRAVAAIRHTTPDGHRIDGFAPDIETRHEGTNENVEFVRAYTTWLRHNVGPDYPLIAVIPNPTPYRISQGYPFAEIVSVFDAVAPMVYWMNREPGADVAHAVSYLSQFGKPVFPVGQAYDGGIDGGPAGIPNRDALIRFMQVADGMGTVGISFWSWQHASTEAWDAIGDAMEYRLGYGAPETLRPAMIRAYQLQLAYWGYGTPATGEWYPAMTGAVTAFQRDSGLPQSGIIDVATRHEMLRPRLAPVHPVGH